MNNKNFQKEQIVTKNQPNDQGYMSDMKTITWNHPNDQGYTQSDM